MLESQYEILRDIKRIFSGYLEEKSLRKTPERFTILQEIYKFNDHFDAETLYNHLKTHNYNISRATVYNTLDLLVSCDLIKKHQFGNAQTQYEKAYHYKQHDHLICDQCEKVLEFCDPRIEQIQSKIGELMQFNIHGHSLILYGNCQRDNCPNLKSIKNQKIERVQQK